MDYLDGLKVTTRILISGRPEGENHRRNDNRSKGQRKRVRWEEREIDAEIGPAQRQRCEDAPLLAFKIEEGATNQRMQNVGSVLMLERQKNISPYELTTWFEPTP